MHDTNVRGRVDGEIKRRRIVTVFMYDATTWTLTEILESELDGTYTRIMRAIVNISCRQNQTKSHLYEPITDNSLI